MATWEEIKASHPPSCSCVYCLHGPGAATGNLQAPPPVSARSPEPLPPEPTAPPPPTEEPPAPEHEPEREEPRRPSHVPHTPTKHHKR